MLMLSLVAKTSISITQTSWNYPHKNIPVNYTGKETEAQPTGWLDASASDFLGASAGKLRGNHYFNPCSLIATPLSLCCRISTTPPTVNGTCRACTWHSTLPMWQYEVQGEKTRRVVFSSGLHLITWAQIPQSSQKPLDLPLMKYWATINATKSDGTTSKTLCPSPVLPPLALPLSPLGPPGRGTCPYTARELGSGPCSSPARCPGQRRYSWHGAALGQPVPPLWWNKAEPAANFTPTPQPSAESFLAGCEVTTHSLLPGTPNSADNRSKKLSVARGLLVVPVKHQCQLWVKTVLVDLLRMLQAGVYELLRSRTSPLRLLSTQDCYKDPCLYIRNHGIQDF